MVRWISKKAYFTSKGSVNIAFSAQIMPYLTELKGRYTSYDLKEVAKFNNAYSVRFYEFLIQFKNNQTRRIAVSDLRDMLAIGNKYPAIKDFKKYVVMPALEDINEFSNVTVELGQEKEGKVITHFIFNYVIKAAPAIEKPKQLTVAQWANLPENQSKTRGKTEAEIRAMMSTKK